MGETVDKVLDYLGEKPRKPAAKVLAYPGAGKKPGRRSGVATADAIVSGDAPGRLADTWMVGKSTFGNAATGSWR